MSINQKSKIRQALTYSHLLDLENVIVRRWNVQMTWHLMTSTQKTWNWLAILKTCDSTWTCPQRLDRLKVDWSTIWPNDTHVNLSTVIVLFHILFFKLTLVFVVVTGCFFLLFCLENTTSEASKACLLPLCVNKATEACVELIKLVFPDIPMACECSIRVIAASRRSSSVLPNPEAKHTQTWRYRRQARCSPLFGVRYIY